MEMIKLTNKDNIVNSYGIKPTLPYDIEGVLVEKNGKDIKVEKTIDNKRVEYSLRLKEEIGENIGKNITIKKENIISLKLEEKEERLEEQSLKVEDVIKALELEYTEANIKIIENLLSNGISLVKENIDSYIKSKEYINKVIEGIDTESFIKLMDRGIDIESENLQNVVEALEDVKNKKIPFSIKRFLKLEKDLTYKEAEEVSKEIYGQRMGKDVYDTIIALHKEKLPITKENIDRTLEVMSKVHNLKGLKDDTYIKILNENKIFNIENLYKISKHYTVASIGNNLGAKNFEPFTIKEDTNIEGLKEMLSNLDIESNLGNINILREFIVNDMAMDKDNYNKVISMKETVKELIELLGKEEIAKLITNNIGLIKEDIFNLVEELKKEKPEIKTEELLSYENIESIKKDLEILGRIKDKDLLQLIKNGEEFSLKTIKEIVDTNIPKELNIEHKTLDKTKEIVNIFNTLGEKINVGISRLVSRRFNLVTLENLYTSQVESDEFKANDISVDKIQEGLVEENLMQIEYRKARNNLTTSIVREGIKEGKLLEQMPIKELNNYIENKTNKYKERETTRKEIIQIKGKEDKIIPIIMKNNLSMTLGEIKGINSLLNGEKGINSILKNIIQTDRPIYKEEIRAEIKLLQEQISTSLKNGDEGLKEEYKQLLNTLERLNNQTIEKYSQTKAEQVEGYQAIDKDVSRLEEQVNQLVEKIEIENPELKIEEPINKEKLENILKDLGILGKIKDKDFLELIKSGEEFNIKAIKEIIDTNMPKELTIEHKVLDEAKNITNILNVLGEKMNVGIPSLTIREYTSITLKNLYISQVQVNKSQVNNISVDKIQEELIYEEYAKARNNLTTDIVREGIMDGKILEQMPIKELNNYIEKKINKYKKGDKETKQIKDNEEKIIPISIKNNPAMTLGKIKNTNSLVNGEKGINNISKDIKETYDPIYNKELKAEIKQLQQQISTNIKDEGLKEEYKRIVHSLNGSNNSSNKNQDQKKDRQLEEYITIKRKISQKDMVLQLPIELDNEYKNLNIIVPNISKGIDKNNMKFYISLETENLGMITMDIYVNGKEVKINIEEKYDILKENIDILEKKLEKTGYILNREDDVALL